MKTISIDEFKTIVASKAWQHEQNHEIVEKYDYEQEDTDEDGNPVQYDIPMAWGYATKISTLTLSDLTIKITYTEGFSFDQFDADSLATYTEGHENVWVIDGIVVVDDDGDVIGDEDLAAEYLNGSYSHIDYSFLDDQFNETNDIDIDEEDNDMETYTLRVDNAPDIRFTGELLGSASSTDNNAAYHSYSGETGRWAELDLYKTKGGKYICHQVGRTRWQGERDRFSGKVCETVEEVKKFFGHRWLAKALYEDADIDTAVEVD